MKDENEGFIEYGFDLIICKIIRACIQWATLFRCGINKIDIRFNLLLIQQLEIYF